MFGMPVVVLVYVCKFIRNRRWSAGFLISAVMFIGFWVAALLFWNYITAHYWNLSFTSALHAAGDTARYGNPVEDTSEGVLVSLIAMSTLSAVVAGVIAGIARLVWRRRS